MITDLEKKMSQSVGVRSDFLVNSVLLFRKYINDDINQDIVTNAVSRYSIDDYAKIDFVIQHYKSKIELLSSDFGIMAHSVRIIGIVGFMIFGIVNVNPVLLHDSDDDQDRISEFLCCYNLRVIDKLRVV